MRVLVTGAAGFIGSHLARRLLREGHQVVGIDDLSSGMIENIDPGVQFHREDIRSRAILPIFRGVDAVFHLAAKNCLSDCLQDPVMTADVNVVGTANILEMARSASVPKVIYADTSAEYEGVLEYPSRIECVAPISVYAKSKYAGASFCEAYERYYGLHITVVRYFNVYGPAQDWRRTIPPLMSAFAMRLLNNERPVIYGTGEKRRDFIYIDDIINFNLLALMDPRTSGHTYNVGTGVNYSVNEVFELVEGKLKTGLRPIYKDDLPGEAEVTLADITNERALGWAPQVGLSDGIDRSIAYIREEVLGEGRGLGRR